MDKFFKERVGYKQLSWDCLAKTLPDKIYLEIKEKMNTLFKANKIINIVLDKNNN